MKNSFVKVMLLSLVLILTITNAVFANDSKTTNSLIEEFNQKVETYEKERGDLLAQLELAYDKNDAVVYRDVKHSLMELKYPVLSEEESSLILSSISEDDYETANWLFSNSRYYRPTLALKSEGDGFMYSQKFTANPGTEVALPTIRSAKTLVFKGWKTEDGSVFYEEGSVIKMPVSDLTLIAVFEKDPSIVEGSSIAVEKVEVKNSDNLSIEKGKQSDLKITLKNNGTSDLSNLKISFDSDDPLFVVLTDSSSCRFLMSSDQVSVYYRVVSKADVGTKLKGTVRITDSADNCWSEDIVLSVR